MSDSDVVIRVEGLGKKYTIKHEQQLRHNTLRDAVAHQAAALGRWANPFTLAGQLSRARRHADYLKDRGEEDFWALKDVSFEIRRGERVGIIGRNGAGKSTLLKILSRITEPTTGRVEITGRVASLLEVGTGFHPELTGRENIYLNGAILGMTRREIRSKFDEIVDFAEVERFLDTPVKRYSSGMYVRLAFAVAAHLEPEILVVDEVLAVGDASFQKKCLGKMKSVQNEGRTLIFVSHQLDTMASLCDRCIYLVTGRVGSNGDTREVIAAYSNSLIASSNSSGTQEIERDPEKPFQVCKIEVQGIDGTKRTDFDMFDVIIIEIEADVNKPDNNQIISLTVTGNGMPIFMTFSSDCSSQSNQFITKGKYIAKVKIPCPLLKPGTYQLDVKTGKANSDIYQDLPSVISWNVSLISRDGSLSSFSAKRPGIIATCLNWEVSSQPNPQL